MLEFSDAQMLSALGQWLWPLLRISGFLLTAPIIATRSVPMRVRISLALVLCIAIAPALPPQPSLSDLGTQGFALAAAQLVIGVALGLVFRLMFLVFEFAGQLAAQQMGLGFASLIDPQTGAQVPVLSQFYILLATLLMFAIDAHLVLIQVLAESFVVLPTSDQAIAPGGLRAVVRWSADLIALALLFSLPVVIALLAINFSLGVMARSAPQLNIFAVGFPVMILVGVVLVFVSLSHLAPFTASLFDKSLIVADEVLRAR
ncbi:MAG: flagellar biosynthetic protein FliR [Pseudomonadota bacterium]